MINAGVLEDQPESQDDQCKFQGNLQEWRSALLLETRLEQHFQEEEEEPDNATCDVVNLLKGITKTNKASSSGAEVTPPVECDEDFLHAPDIDESLECDVLNLPVELSKRALLEKLVEPLLRYDEIKVIKSVVIKPRVTNNVARLLLLITKSPTHASFVVKEGKHPYSRQYQCMNDTCE